MVMMMMNHLYSETPMKYALNQPEPNSLCMNPRNLQIKATSGQQVNNAPNTFQTLEIFQDRIYIKKSRVFYFRNEFRVRRSRTCKQK